MKEYKQFIKKLGVTPSKALFRDDATFIPTFSLYLTNFCNLKCEYCISKDITELTRHDMPDDVFDSFLDSISNLDDVEIQLMGGEPCAHPKAYELIKRLQDQKNISNICILTNGIHPGAVKALKKLDSNDKIDIEITFHKTQVKGRLIDVFKNTVNEVKKFTDSYWINTEVDLGVVNQRQLHIDGKIADNVRDSKYYLIANNKVKELSFNKVKLLKLDHLKGWCCYPYKCDVYSNGDFVLPCFNLNGNVNTHKFADLKPIVCPHARCINQGVLEFVKYK